MERSMKQMNTVTLPVRGLNFAGCAREIEKHLGKLEPIKQVEASYVSQSVMITYDETRLGEAQLREMVKDCGFACGAPLTRFPGPIATVSRPNRLWLILQWNIVRRLRPHRRWTRV